MRRRGSRSFLKQKWNRSVSERKARRLQSTRRLFRFVWKSDVAVRHADTFAGGKSVTSTSQDKHHSCGSFSQRTEPKRLLRTRCYKSAAYTSQKKMWKREKDERKKNGTGWLFGRVVEVRSVFFSFLAQLTRLRGKRGDTTGEVLRFFFPFYCFKLLPRSPTTEWDWGQGKDVERNKKQREGLPETYECVEEIAAARKKRERAKIYKQRKKRMTTYRQRGIKARHRRAEKRKKKEGGEENTCSASVFRQSFFFFPFFPDSTRR